MRISSSDTIAGVPAIKLRAFFRAYNDRTFCARAIEIKLGLRKSAARKLTERLELLGLIENTGQGSGEMLGYRTTIKGNAIALATAAKPLSRPAAEEALHRFLQRAHAVNASSDYLLRVESVVVFGSFLTDKEKLNDVDVAIELKPRIMDGGKWSEASNRRVAIARKNGRTFRNFIELLGWPEWEVRLALKHRSRTISIHTIDEIRLVQGVRYRVLLGDATHLKEILNLATLVDEVPVRD